MKVLIVGSADTIFITNYVKSLKKVMDIEVHVYSPHPRTGNYDSYPYDYVHFEDEIKFKSKLLNKVQFLLTPFIFKKRLSRFLKKQKTVYDIIHFHRIFPGWVVPPNSYKKYCKKMLMTYWGGELDVEHILFSKRIYRYLLKKMFKKTDMVLNSFSDKRYFQWFPFIRNKSQYAVFGSSIVNEINDYKGTREDAKKELGIHKDTITVLLGYSGKRMHNQGKIFKRVVEDSNYQANKEKFHFIVSMTRGGSEEFATELENGFKEAGASYTIIKGGYSSDRDVAILRLATDFVFQLSDFDAVSASIRECICAGSIVITGNWLQYDMLKNTGFKYPEVTDIDEGVKLFYHLQNNYPTCLEEYEINKRLGENEYSWGNCIKPWAEAYKKVVLQ